MTLTFNEKTHVYRLDGKHVPSVTTIIDVLPKPGLARAAAKLVSEFVADNKALILAMYESLDRDGIVDALKGQPWVQWKAAASRGTTLHGIAERLLGDEDVDVAPLLVPVVENALRFLDEWHIQPVLVERVVGNREHWYAGKFDLVADCRRGRGIFDWKSGKKIYASTVFQLNGYGHAEFYPDGKQELPMSELGIEQAWGVHIYAEDYDVYPLPYGPDIFDEFLAIRRVYDINTRAEGDWKIPGTGYVGLPVTPQLEDVSA